MNSEQLHSIGLQQNFSCARPVHKDELWADASPLAICDTWKNSKHLLMLVHSHLYKSSSAMVLG